MKKTRATKKACLSLDTQLTPEFVSRAIISNPTKILDNEALKFEYLFGQDPLPEFEAYSSDYSVPFVRQLLAQVAKLEWGKRSAVIMCLALRKDIPEHHSLFYALNLTNKKQVSNYIKEYPQFTSWKTLKRVYFAHIALEDLSRDLRIYTPADGKNMVPLISFYYRTNPSPEDRYAAFKDIVAMAKSKGVPSWDNKTDIDAKLIAPNLDMILSEPDSGAELVSDIFTYCWGVGRSKKLGQIHDLLFKRITSDLSNVTLETVTTFMEIYAPMLGGLDRDCFIHSHKVLLRFFNSYTVGLYRHLYVGAITNLITAEFANEPSFELQVHAALKSGKWHWLNEQYLFSSILRKANINF